MTELIDQLFQKPKRDKGVNAPTFKKYSPGLIQQADLLFLPNDNGYKYALVVVDIGSKITDAEPLKEKSSNTVLKAFEAIYKRNLLKIPKSIEVDNGTEFQGAVKTWFENKNVIFKVKKPYRHRQQAMVERRNQMIGKMLFKRMTEEELLTGNPSTQWTDEIKDVKKEINKKKPVKKTKTQAQIQCEGDACTLLSEGQKVRVALEAPVDVATGKKLHGKFRDTDIRWELQPKIIKEVILQPGQPPLYLVSDKDGNTDRKQAYTKSQLLPVKQNEKAPREAAIRPITDKGVKKYIVERIVDKKKEKNRIFYLIKFKGYKEPEWQPRTELIKDIPDLIEEYEKKKSN